MATVGDQSSPRVEYLLGDEMKVPDEAAAMIRGDSYRLHEKRRSGLLQKAPAPTQPAPA
ncbi:MAG: hypothetical protein ACREFO_16790 [Acetobacteraceae bacterium]